MDIMQLYKILSPVFIEQIGQDEVRSTVKLANDFVKIIAGEDEESDIYLLATSIIETETGENAENVTFMYPTLKFNSFELFVMHRFMLQLYEKCSFGQRGYDYDYVLHGWKNQEKIADVSNLSNADYELRVREDIERYPELEDWYLNFERIHRELTRKSVSKEMSLVIISIMTELYEDRNINTSGENVLAVIFHALLAEYIISRSVKF